MPSSALGSRRGYNLVERETMNIINCVPRRSEIYIIIMAIREKFSRQSNEFHGE